MQLIHWFTGNKMYESEDTSVLLNAIMVSVAHGATTVNVLPENQFFWRFSLFFQVVCSSGFCRRPQWHLGYSCIFNLPKTLLLSSTSRKFIKKPIAAIGPVLKSSIAEMPTHADTYRITDVSVFIQISTPNTAVLQILVSNDMESKVSIEFIIFAQISNNMVLSWKTSIEFPYYSPPF